MYRKEVNERSPLRVFERSMHGGLGRGNVGVIVARPGVGKTAVLVQIALDDLLHKKCVLHISHEHPVERVRAHYDELFHELAMSHALSHAGSIHLEVERNRLIYSHLAPGQHEAPMSARGGASSIAKIEHTVSFAHDVAHFRPHTVIIDGFDFDHATRDAVDALRALAKRLDVEMWLSAKTAEYVTQEPPPSATPKSTPGEVRRFFDQLSVIVLLRPDGDTVRLSLLKEHDNPDLEALHLRLDPNTMCVVDDDLDADPASKRSPGKFHLYSGGARGAETEFGRCAEAWGVRETHFSFDGHPYRERERGVVVLNDDELRKGDFSLVYASHRLGRPLSQIPDIRRILQTVWHQITAASEVFVVGAIEDGGTVRGGTGWGAELARLWSKPVCVFDQTERAWFTWDGVGWQKTDAPIIRRTSFAGIGTTRLTPEGRSAIRALFERSFGPPP